jgi:hypothetical protein
VAPEPFHTPDLLCFVTMGLTLSTQGESLYAV